MNKEFFSSNELSELQALEVRGGNTASTMSQSECVNEKTGCGSGVDQTKCINKEAGCGSTIVVTYNCK
jgi:hypothetical protein